MSETKYKSAEKKPEYVFATNINGNDLTGIMDVNNQRLLCLCTKGNADIILNALAVQQNIKSLNL